MAETYSFMTKEDCLNISYLIDDWIKQGNKDQQKLESFQNKVKGVISVLSRIDNINVIVTRDSKNDNITNVKIKIIDLK